MECSQWTQEILAAIFSFALTSSNNHQSELMSDMGILFSISWQRRWWVEYYTSFLCTPAVCTTNMFTLKPLCVKKRTGESSMKVRGMTSWPQGNWFTSAGFRRCKKQTSISTSEHLLLKNPRHFNKSLLSKHSQDKWRLNPIRHSSAWTLYRMYTAIKPSMDVGLPAGESSTACFSYFPPAAEFTCGRMCTCIMADIRRGQTRVTRHWAQLEINTLTVGVVCLTIIV